MKNYSITESVPDKKHQKIKVVKVDFFKGISVEILTYGATIKSIKVPDINGKRENIVLSYDTIEEYLNDQAYLGCTVGRFANRINQGRFSIDEKGYQLSVNNDGNHLHGGNEGFNKKNWEIDSIVKKADAVAIKLTHYSHDAEEGYPGNLQVSVTYLLASDSIKIIYTATSDEDTIFSPTNHSYFNLSGRFSNVIDEHQLNISASKILELGEGNVPTGRILSILGTSNDFSLPRKVGSFKYDHCYILKGHIGLTEDKSGRTMKIVSSLPSVQLYTGDHLHQFGFSNRMGICLEPQFFPDSPNHKTFPCVILRKGEIFDHNIIYRFNIKGQ